MYHSTPYTPTVDDSGSTMLTGLPPLPFSRSHNRGDCDYEELVGGQSGRDNIPGISPRPTVYLRYDSATHLLSDPVNLFNIETKPIGVSYQIFLEIKSNSDVPLEICDFVLEQSIPVSLSAVMVLGLPHCRKSRFINELFTKMIKIKAHIGSCENPIAEHMSMTEDLLGLSAYTLCVLGTFTYGEIAWSLSSRRQGITYSVVSSIIRELKMKMLNFENIQLQCKPPPNMLPVFIEHLKWITNYVSEIFKMSIEKNKLDMLSSGLSIVNVFDVGVNKAVYDLIPYIAHYCDNLIRLVFFDVERDSTEMFSKCPQLNEQKYRDRHDDKFVMQWRNRGEYLIHFASLGYQPLLPQTAGDTVIIGSRDETPANTSPAGSCSNSLKFNQAKESIKEHLKDKGNVIKKYMELSLNDCEMEATSMVEKLITITDHRCLLPVKWLFLRSYLSSHSNLFIILPKQDIIQYAVSLKMDKNEVDKCLSTFRNYGSILHFHDFPMIEEYVIVDIFNFAKALGKLYYPDEHNQASEYHSKYGIISKSCVKELIEQQPYKCPVDAFMNVATTLRMASEISEESLIIKPDGTPYDHEISYFIPTARTGTLVRPEADSYSSVYLRVESTQFPANVQTSIASAMVNEIKMSFILSESANVCEFEIGRGDQITRIKTLYYGAVTELKLIQCENDDDENFVKTTIEDLSNILKACCIAFTQQSQRLRRLKFNIGLKCLESSEDDVVIHDIPLSSDRFCSSSRCCDYYSCEHKEIQFWLEAAKQCKHLNVHNMKGERARIEFAKFKDIAEQFKDASKLEVIQKLSNALQISPRKFQELRDYEIPPYDRLVMKLLLLWEQKEKEATEQFPSEDQLNLIMESLQQWT